MSTEHKWVLNNIHTINEKSFASTQFGKHCLRKKIQYDKEWHQIPFFHHGIELFSTIGSGFDFVSEEISRRQVSETIFGHNLVTLGAFSTSRTTQNPNHWKSSFGQGGFVDGFSFQCLKDFKPKKKFFFTFKNNNCSLPILCKYVWCFWTKHLAKF